MKASKYKDAYAHLETSHVLALRNAVLPKNHSDWAVHIDLFYLMIASGRRYVSLFELETTQLLEHPGHGRYLQLADPRMGRPLVIPLWVFPGTEAIIAKYRDHSTDAHWLLDKRYQVSLEQFFRILHQITSTLPDFPFRLSSTHAINTFVYFLHEHRVPYEVISAMTGITAKWLQPAYRRMQAGEVLAAAQDIFIQELEV